MSADDSKQSDDISRGSVDSDFDSDYNSDTQGFDARAPVPRLPRSSTDSTSPNFSEQDFDDDSADVSDRGISDDGEDDDEYNDNDDEDDEDEDDEDEVESLRRDYEEQLELTRRFQDQFKALKARVEEEKQRDTKRIADLSEQVETLKNEKAQLEKQLQSGPSLSGFTALQNKLKAMSDDLAKQRKINQELILTSNSHIKSFQEEIDKFEERNKSLQAQLDEERDSHRQTLQQLFAIQKQVASPIPAVRDQEVRIRFTFEGPDITQAVLVPENDMDRKKLIEENDIVKSKYFALSQKQVVLRDELEASKKELQKSEERIKSMSEEVHALRAKHSSALEQIEKMNAERSQSTPILVTPAKGEGNGESSSPSLSPTKQDLEYLQKEALRIFGIYCMTGLDKDISLPPEMRQELFSVILNLSLLTPKVFDPSKELVTSRVENSDAFKEWLSKNPELQAQRSQLKMPTASSSNASETAGGDSSSGEEKTDVKPSPVPSPKLSEEQESSSTFTFLFNSLEHKKELQEWMDKNGFGNIMSFLLDVSQFSLVKVKPHSGKHHHKHKMTRSRTSSLADPSVGDDSSHSKKHSRSPSKHDSLVIPSLSPEGAAAIAASSRLLAPPPVIPDNDKAQKRLSLPRAGDEDKNPLIRSITNADITIRGRSASSSIRPMVGLSPRGPSANSILVPSAKSSGTSPSPVSLVGNGRRTLHGRSHLTGSMKLPTTPLALSVMGFEEGSEKPEKVQPRSIGHSGSDAYVKDALKDIERIIGESQESITFVTATVVVGSVSCMVPVRDTVWVASQCSDLSGSSGSENSNLIQVFNRDSLSLLFDIHFDVPITSMKWIGRHIWITTEKDDIRYLDPDDHKVWKSLKGHSVGPVLDVIKAGKYVWSIGSDYRVCVWDPVSMKLHKSLMTTHVMTSVLYVDGVVWIGTMLGLVFYDAKEFKQIKTLRTTASGRVQTLEVVPTPPGGSSDKMNTIMGMSVSSLVRVNQEVWAVHEEKSMISVWDASCRTMLSVFEVKQIRSVAIVGDIALACSWDRKIRIIDVHTHSVVNEVSSNHEGNIMSAIVTKSSDALNVWTGGVDHNVNVWSTGLKPHQFKEGGSRSCLCEVCKKTLKSFGTKSVICKNCGFSVHRKCFDQLTNGCACPGKPLVL